MLTVLFLALLSEPPAITKEACYFTLEEASQAAGITLTKMTPGLSRTDEQACQYGSDKIANLVMLTRLVPGNAGGRTLEDRLNDYKRNKRYEYKDLGAPAYDVGNNSIAVTKNGTLVQVSVLFQHGMPLDAKKALAKALAAKL